MSKPIPFQPVKFDLGSITATHGAMEAIGANACSELILRHAVNDWGDLDEHDRLLNDSAVLTGEDRLFSAYTVGEHRVYVITEADRSVTTCCLAEEY